MATLNVPVARKRLARVHELISSGKFNGASSFVLAADTDTEDSKASCFQVWVFGYRISDSIMVLTADTLFFCASAKKLLFLKGLAESSNLPFKVKLLERSKVVEDNKASFNTMIEALKHGGPTAGHFAKDVAESPLCAAWLAALQAAGVALTDIADRVADLNIVKDQDERTTLVAAAAVTSAAFSKTLKNAILNSIDNEEPTPHSKVGAAVDKGFEPERVQAYLQTLKLAVPVDAQEVDMVSPPVVQSGAYSLKPSAVSDDEQLKSSGAVVCWMATRYRGYYAGVGRTFIIAPTKKQEENYTFLLDLQERVIKGLRPGASIASLCDLITRHVADTRPDLAPHLTKNFGFGTGVSFREATYLLSSKTARTVAEHMSFYVCVGLENVPAPEGAYSLLLADTVVVEAEGGRALTTARKLYKDIHFVFKDEEEEEEKEEKERNKNVETALRKAGLDDGRRTRTRARPVDVSGEEKRREHQEELSRLAFEATRKRLEQGEDDDKEEDGSMKQTIAYPRFEDVHQTVLDEMRKLKIFIDQKREAVILPIFGLATPFHISTIKNTSFNDQDEVQVMLRINFATPTGFAQRSEFTGREGSVYLKEMTYTSQSRDGLSNANRLIKEMQKRHRTREQERKEQETLVEQEDLQLNRNGPAVRLADVFMRPQVESVRGKRMTGSLEAHQNGLRFSQPRTGDTVDILFSNIKHAFYQPCKHELMIILHFHLKNGIIIGKKQHRDVQFYTEVGEQSVDLQRGRNTVEQEEMEMEQREKLLRQKFSKLFEAFFKKVEEIAGNKNISLDFDVPFPDLGFEGVATKAKVVLQPTTHCLINVTEWPPFVLTLSEVERVNFERVDFTLRNFDMVFIFRDYKRLPALVGAIPSESLEAIKDWLNSCDIVYTETSVNLDWRKIMRTANADMEGFLEQGGFNAILGGYLPEELASDGDEEEEEEEEEEGEEEQGDAENGTSKGNGEQAASKLAAKAAKKKSKPKKEDSEPESSEYEPSGDDSSSSSEDYSDEDEEEDGEESGSGSGSDELGSDEEEGLSWDELEQKALRDDKESLRKEAEYDERERHKTKGSKAGGSAGGGGGKSGAAKAAGTKPPPPHSGGGGGGGGGVKRPAESAPSKMAKKPK